MHDGGPMSLVRYRLPLVILVRLHDCRLLSGRSSLCIVLTFSSNVLGLRFASEDGDPFCAGSVVSIYVIADSLKPSIAMDFIVRVLRETSDCEVEHAFEKVVLAS